MLGEEQPGGVKATLNPRRENGTRKDRHHWHLKDLGVYHLETHFLQINQEHRTKMTLVKILGSFLYKR
jgi:hypothetical protein